MKTITIDWDTYQEEKAGFINKGFKDGVDTIYQVAKAYLHLKNEPQAFISEVFSILEYNEDNARNIYMLLKSYGISQKQIEAYWEGEE